MADEDRSSNSPGSGATVADNVATHTVTNYLLSCYQGRFAFLNILSQLDYPSLNVAIITETRQVLDQVAFWHEELWAGRNLFSAAWSFAETVDAQRALDLLTKLKPELYSTARDIGAIVANARGNLDSPQIAFLAGCIGRFSYAREHSVKGFVEMGARLPGTVDVNRFAVLIPAAQEDVRLTHALLEIIKKRAPNFDGGFVRGLVEKGASLIGLFRTQAHEINEIVAKYQGGLTFENADFTPDESRIWIELRLGPSIAGYWRAHGFSAQESEPWITLQTVAPGIAEAWRLFGFHADTAMPWLRSGFPPRLAKTWYDAGFDEKEARAQIERGVQDPSKINKNE